MGNVQPLEHHACAAVYSKLNYMHNLNFLPLFFLSLNVHRRVRCITFKNTVSPATCILIYIYIYIYIVVCKWLEHTPLSFFACCSTKNDKVCVLNPCKRFNSLCPIIYHIYFSYTAYVVF